jgi:hypothetical protein
MPEEVVTNGRGAVYVVDNQAMPGYIKIGRTKDPVSRIKALYDTNVPFPFRCLFVRKVDDMGRVECVLQNTFAHFRSNSRREFFTVEPEKVINILKLIPGKTITKEVEAAVNGVLSVVEKKEVAAKYKEVLSRNEIPADFKSYRDLKGLLKPGDNFQTGYFVIRVARLHALKKVQYYKFDGVNFYRKDIFSEQASQEGILKGSPQIPLNFSR